MMLFLQPKQESLRCAAEWSRALREIQVNVMAARQEAFGEVLRCADGVGEVQGGGAHAGEDFFAYQPGWSCPTRSPGFMPPQAIG